MKNLFQCLAMLALSAAVAGSAGAYTPEELCHRHLDRMISAQSSRLVKELAKCAKRWIDPEDFVDECTPWIGDDNNLHANGPRMDSGLNRVERHGDNKFPRKCSGAPVRVYEPACSNITDPAQQFRRCIYNDHSLGFLLDLVDITTDLEPKCRYQSLNRARIVWRDWIISDSERTFKRGLRAVKAACGTDTEHWETIRDSVLVHSSELNQTVR